MYQPRHFAEHRPEVLQGLIRAHPLATLAWLGPDGLAADHLPMLLEQDPARSPLGVLRGHVARANPLWQQYDPAQEVLLVFQGAQSYVSPSAYPGKAAHGKVVPTWNYAVVHARGPLVVCDDAEWVHALVTRLTGRHEGGRSTPWAVSDAPHDYVQAMTRAIVGIEVPLTTLVGKWKASQNRDAADRSGVVADLAGQGEQGAAMAALVAGAMTGSQG